jgi:hypothetical protein
MYPTNIRTTVMGIVWSHENIPVSETRTVLYQGYTINQKTLQKWYVVCAVEASNNWDISSSWKDESNHLRENIFNPREWIWETMLHIPSWEMESHLDRSILWN